MKLISYDKMIEDGFEEIPFTFSGDYFGGIVQKSNFLILVSELSRFKGIYEVYGEYSASGIAYNPKELTKKGKDKIDQIKESLEDYCVLDDMHYSRLEYKTINKSFNEEYKYTNFPKSKKAKIRQIVLDHIGDYVFVETGCIAFIDWDKVREEAEK